MIPANDIRQIREKLLEMWEGASPEVKKLAQDPKILQQFHTLIRGLEEYKNSFVAAYRKSLKGIAPDWQSQADPTQAVIQADALARKSNHCGERMLVLLLKAAHQELGIKMGMQAGHYRLSKIETVTDDILEEIMYVALQECQPKNEGA